MINTLCLLCVNMTYCQMVEPYLVSCLRVYFHSSCLAWNANIIIFLLKRGKFCSEIKSWLYIVNFNVQSPEFVSKNNGVQSWCRVLVVSPLALLMAKQVWYLLPLPCIHVSIIFLRKVDSGHKFCECAGEVCSCFAIFSRLFFPSSLPMHPWEPVDGAR